MAVHNKKSVTHKITSVFVPNRHNKYRPWIAKIPGVFFLAFILVGLHLVMNGIISERFDLNSSQSKEVERQLLSEVNKKRAGVGRSYLTIDERLSRAAQRKAEHMIKNNYWSHESPDGIGAWSFIHKEKYYYSVSAENLARGFRTAEGVVEGWQASPSHRKAMTNLDYTDSGFGVAKGILDGELTTVYVALFAQPLNGATLSSVENSRKVLALQGQTSRLVANSDAVEFSLLNPLSLNSTLTLPGKIAFAVLTGLIIIYLSQHILIKKKRVVWQPKVHEHPIFRLAIVVVIIAIIVATSFGSIN